MGKILKFLVLFLIGGFTYFLMEFIWRGYSHWTMFLVGAVAFLLIGEINENLKWDMPIWEQGLIASIGITGLELISGLFINKVFEWNVWDYSHLPFNFLGQIQLWHSVLWFFVGLFAIILDDVCRWLIFGEERPRYRLI